jgi:hypothetical protein
MKNIGIIIVVVLIAAVLGFTVGRQQPAQQAAPAAEARQPSAPLSESKLFARLDYKAMDAHGMPHDILENSLKGCMQTCVGAGQKYQICEDRCSCVMNQFASSMEKNEFVSMDTSIALKQPINPATKTKIDTALANCTK